MNSGNSRTFDPHRLLLNLSEIINFKKVVNILLYQILAFYYTWKNIKNWYKNNKFKISAPTWNENFELPDGSYSVSDIQDYFEYIIRKHETVTGNSAIRI